MSVDGIKFNGVERMCKQCGNCTKQHEWSVDDAIDKVEESAII